jgi:hypothetical protein
MVHPGCTKWGVVCGLLSMLSSLYKVPFNECWHSSIRIWHRIFLKCLNFRQEKFSWKIWWPSILKRCWKTSALWCPVCVSCVTGNMVHVTTENLPFYDYSHPMTYTYLPWECWYCGQVRASEVMKHRVPGSSTNVCYDVHIHTSYMYTCM